MSSSNRDTVKEYIEHQADHHQGRSYEAEFVAMLRKSGITLDPKEAFGWEWRPWRDSGGIVSPPGTAVPGFPMPCLRH